MIKDYNRLTELYHKYLSKDITDDERGEFLAYLQNPIYTKIFEGLISHSYEFPEILNDLESSAKDRIFSAIVNHGKESRSKALSLWPKFLIAAAILVMIFSASIVYLNGGLSSTKSIVVSNTDIAPGISEATLTLSNGKKIRLSDAQNGEIAEEAGVRVVKSKNGEVLYEIKGTSDGVSRLNTLSTANGQTYKVRLPDGSYIWLNSASSITYSSKLIEDGKRLIKLSGEAYFEVAKDKVHPFIVATENQKVEVLGTHFNINSYPDEAIVRTTLVEGSVSVTSGKFKRTIKPGEQAINDGHKLEVNEVNTENVVDWKNGDFNLDELDFRIGMRKIARWYDVDIIYESSVPQNIKTGGWISRSRNLSTILKHIQSSGQVSFKVEGKKIYVSK